MQQLTPQFLQIVVTVTDPEGEPLEFSVRIRPKGAGKQLVDFMHIKVGFIIAPRLVIAILTNFGTFRGIQWTLNGNTPQFARFSSLWSLSTLALRPSTQARSCDRVAPVLLKPLLTRGCPSPRFQATVIACSH